MLASILSLALSVLSLAPATAQIDTGVLDRAARALRSSPVYVDSSAERRDVDARRLSDRIGSGGSAIFIAVLPDSAVAEAGGDINDLPQALGQRIGLTGTVGVVAGNSFRAASTVLPPGRASSIATSSFQARSEDGTEAVLAEFIDRVAAAQGTTPEPSGSGDRPFDNGEGQSDGDGGGSSALPALLLIGAAGGGFYLWSRSKRQRREEAVRDEADRSLLRAEVQVLAEDVMRLEPQIALHPDAQPDYEAAVSRFRVAQAALERADDGIDLVRVERVIAEGTYAMDRAKARIDGREPPPPPEDLTRRGRHDEPPVDLDERGEPVYVGYGSPFYGGGWFGGGGGLLTGLFLGQMLGGWGGGYHEQNVYVEDSGGGGDAGWGGGGDWGGGGGGWGGGDWGGGDVGGGDWG